jgi:flavin reductase (DIM6/NTAB) family NADH-FMN oxidoreductase RutF/DNA-binding IclR family transcriptional regulator
MTLGSPDDPLWFRNVLGHFPSGVAVITAMTASGPAGMTVSAFTSVSLHPPMVAFLPARGSTTFAQIREAGSFCVNVVAADQTELCRQFARAGADKYDGVGWEPSGVSGSPLLNGAVAFLDCTIAQIHEAGDHDIVVGRVDALGAADERDPLLFFQGGYGRFTALSLATVFDVGTAELMRQVEQVRPLVENVAAELDMEAVAVTGRGHEMLVVASARTADVHGLPTRVGQRIPMVPPLGALLVAWGDDKSREAWLDSIPAEGGERSDYELLLDRVRERGWSIGLLTDSVAQFDRTVNRASVTSPSLQETADLVAASARLRLEDSEPSDLSSLDPSEVRTIAAPVFDSGRNVAFMIVLITVRPMTLEQIEYTRGRVLKAAAEMSAELGAVELI